MSIEKKKAYRLFKVAKELNVGSSTLVEHLQTLDFEVDNNPNQKLTPEMYEVLIKEYASDQNLKEKAEALREQKKEAQAEPEEAAPQEEPILSAAELRSGLLNKGKQGESKPAEKPVEAKKEAPKPEPVKLPEKPVVAPEKPVEKPVEAKAEPAPEKEESGVGLKVKGKIDLSAFDNKGRKKKEKAAPKEEKKKPVAEKKPEPKPEVKAEKPKEEQPKPVEKPKVEKPAPEKVAKKEEKPAVKVEKKEEKAEAKPEKEETKEASKVIRASDHAPKLAGLTVKGKIELPSEKKKKSSSSSDDSGDAKKKRRRKRKRKSGTAVSTNDNRKNTGKKGGNRGGPKKEELTEKEIQEQIKQTLANIEQRSGRTRQRTRREKRDRDAERRSKEAAARAEAALEIEVTEFITANEFANLLKVPVTEIIMKCLELGLFVSINQRLEGEYLQMLAEEYGYRVKFVGVKDTEFEDEEEEDDPDTLRHRSPIVTVMGHVDHGKTSLLDYVRDANVIAGEAGGITQHIGAYEVKLPDDRLITFLDTPGHEAFTAMRARGAKVTDVAIIVIAADDDVMPQTKEAINHAQAAGVPMVFAFNKVDKENANPDKIKEQLSHLNILVEEWGGKYQSQEISAKTGQGIEELLEKVLLEAEMLELKANPDRNALGSVIEARLDKGRGVVATLLVQNGTLSVGDSFVAGLYFGKVRALMNERGQRVKKVGPSQPAQILGLTGTPQAGDVFKVYSSEQKAKEIANKRNELYRQQAMRQTNRRTLMDVAKGELKELNIILKGDVDGSVEALSDSLQKLSTEEVQVKIVHKAVGQISESDVHLATASDAIVIGFQVRPSASARKLAEKEGVDIRLYSIIYDTINEVRDALEGLLSPEVREEILGSAEVRETFKISKVGTIAGCMVTDGNIHRSNPVRLIRDGIVVYTGKLSSLKRFKDDVAEVKNGFECGMSIENFNDIKVGDVIESFKEVEERRKLS